MKKVVTVHLSGHILQMEEDGYDNLQQVLGRIKGSSANGAEISADVERRLVDMLTEQGLKNSVISLEQMNDLITKLGFAGYLRSQPNYFQSRSRQLFRHPTDKVLGGVCGGLAVYFDVESVLIRIIFAILFFGAGMGLLLYLILWIAIPMANHRLN